VNKLQKDKKCSREFASQHAASGKAMFTERDCLLLFGHPREKVFTQRPVAPIRKRVVVFHRKGGL